MISSSIGLGEGGQRRSIPIHGFKFIDLDEAIQVGRGLVSKLLGDLRFTQAQNSDELEKGLEALFLHPEVLLGSPETSLRTIQNNRDELQRRFTAELPLKFIILGFPHKMPNPLYTVAREPDMGELVALTKLITLTDKIGELYAPGAHITVLAENTVFAPISDISSAEHLSYLSTREWTLS